MATQTHARSNQCARLQPINGGIENPVFAPHHHITFLLLCVCARVVCEQLISMRHTALAHPFRKYSEYREIGEPLLCTEAYTKRAHTHTQTHKREKPLKGKVV